jgi:urate oxidase
MSSLVQNSYGKSRVRLTKVARHPDRHDLKELCVDVHLEGDFSASYLQGDNRLVVPTDTMKNIVYVCAKPHALASIEGFGQALAEHFCRHYAQVAQVTIDIVEQPWQRVTLDGNEHAHAFIGTGPDRRTCSVVLTRQSLRLESGLDDLLLLKTTGSAFSGFHRDAFTTLADSDDRILATSLTARWHYTQPPADYDQCQCRVRRALIEAFAGHRSLGVQQTLHALGEAVLAACAEIEQIHLRMPNRHRLLVNLQSFGLDNNNEIFVATDEPYGLITGTLRREH